MRHEEVCEDCHHDYLSDDYSFYIIDQLDLNGGLDFPCCCCSTLVDLEQHFPNGTFLSDPSFCVQLKFGSNLFTCIPPCIIFCLKWGHGGSQIRCPQGGKIFPWIGNFPIALYYSQKHSCKHWILIHVVTRIQESKIWYDLCVSGMAHSLSCQSQFMYAGKGR